MPVFSSGQSFGINEVFLSDSLDKQKTTSTYSPPFVGVNMLGYYTTIRELTSKHHQEIPINYYEDSFRIFSEAGMNVVRYLFTWEAYETNSSAFIYEINEIAKAADKWDVSVMYANDQYHISSWLDQQSGYGFPHFLFKNKPELPPNGGGASDNKTAKIWWTNWYDRSIKDVEGSDGWTLQSNFLKKVVNVVDNHKSTLGYEILNEPQVYNVTQWDKIGNYNTFIANELRKLSNKTIAFDRQLPSDIGGPIYALPDNMAKMAPKNITNIVFKSTLFGLPTHCSFAEARLNTAARTAQLLGIPLWIGEFNVGITATYPFADINQTGVDLFVEKFKEIGASGWSFWIWSFRPHPINVKNYGLAKVTEDERRIEPTKYFRYLQNTIIKSPSLSSSASSSNDIKENLAFKQRELQIKEWREGEEQGPLQEILLQSKDKQQTGFRNDTKTSDTIGMAINSSLYDSSCPTIVITSIEGVPDDVDLSKSSPTAPITLSLSSSSSIASSYSNNGTGIHNSTTGNNTIRSILVEGEAYDVASKLASVEIHIDDQPYQKVIPKISDENWSQWYALIPITNTTGVHNLVVKAVDMAGNVNYNTVFLNFIESGGENNVLNLPPFTFMGRSTSAGVVSNNTHELLQINDKALAVEKVYQGINFPTAMAFLGNNDILVLEKNTGNVRRIINGRSLPEPLLSANVETEGERGLLGIAVAKNHTKDKTYVFLYLTESDSQYSNVSRGSSSGSDSNNNKTCTAINNTEKKCSPYNIDYSLHNRLYRYELSENGTKLVNPKLLLSVKAVPGPLHNGGNIIFGPDNNLYIGIGDVNENKNNNSRTQAENFKDGLPPDGTAGILRMNQNGDIVIENKNNNYNISLITSMQNSSSLGSYYYAYGIRNIFGMDFDPLTGKLWDTENGPSFGDEINLVEYGFNSGWSKIQGFWEPEGELPGDFTLTPKDLVDFDKRGKYRPPDLTWRYAAGLTALTFLNSDKLGKEYENDIFVGEFHGGRIFHFDLNENRTGLSLKGADLLNDRIVNYTKELQDNHRLFATGLYGITDIEVGPDGYLYILALVRGENNNSCSKNPCISYSSPYVQGEIYRIVRSNN